MVSHSIKEGEKKIFFVFFLVEKKPGKVIGVQLLDILLATKENFNRGRRKKEESY